MCNSLSVYAPSNHKTLLCMQAVGVYSMGGCKVDVDSGLIYSGTKSQALELIKLVTSAANAALMLPKLRFS